jgi:hypothetical protein
MSKTYELVNPFILGTFDRKFTADNSLQAAHLAYQELSQYFTGHMPRFKFSLQRSKKNAQTGGGKQDDYLHFETFEKKIESSEKNVKGIEYAIKPIKTPVNLDNFQQKLQNFLKRKKISNIITSEESLSEQKGGEAVNNTLTGGGYNLGTLEGDILGDLKSGDILTDNNLGTLMGGDLKSGDILNNTLKGGKKYVEDEELDPELEKLLYEDDTETKRKKKTKKGWTALTGPLAGQIINPSPISYYRYDPVLYTEYINYVPVFTEAGRPKRMIYDIYFYNSLKQ